ncbi:class I SAM-dependent methyltransferase [Candidatus Giovannonibacteria bacterium]|nr:class I SAM-dependent methyltransferase [Candidatus Giovannonibacteria bacterium]
MFVNPNHAIENLDLLPGMTGADFGVGPGFYALPAAKRLGNSGTLYAFDIRKEMLEITQSKAKSEGLTNIQAIAADLELPEGSHLKNETVDFILIANILFQVENKKNLARESFRILKKGGKVLLVEWAEEEKPFGPPLKYRINRKEAEEIFLHEGFFFSKEFKAGDHHYGLILKKT